MVLVSAGVVVELALAVLLGVVRRSGSDVGQRHVEGPIPAVAIVVVLATPGLLALIGLRTRRPAMICAAGVACLPLAPVSIAVIPIVIPAVLFFAAFARADMTEASGTNVARAVAVTFASAALVLAAGALFVVGMHQYSYSYGGGGDSGSYVPASHALVAVALVGIDLVVTTMGATVRSARTAAPESR